MARQVKTVCKCDMCGKTEEIIGDGTLPFGWEKVEVPKMRTEAYVWETITRRIIETKEICFECSCKYKMVLESLFGGDSNE